MTTTRAKVAAVLDAATPGPWFDDYGKIGGLDDFGLGEMDTARDARAVATARNLDPYWMALWAAAEEYLATSDAFQNLRATPEEADAAESALRDALAALNAAAENEVKP